MTLSDKEVARLRILLMEIDRGKAQRGLYIENRTRQIRLMLTKAERREKNKLNDYSMLYLN